LLVATITKQSTVNTVDEILRTANPYYTGEILGKMRNCGMRNEESKV